MLHGDGFHVFLFFLKLLVYMTIQAYFISHQNGFKIKTQLRNKPVLLKILTVKTLR